MIFFTRKVLVLSLALVLSACQTSRFDNVAEHQPQQPSSEVKDSAPLGPIPTFFKTIVPKPEPLSPYGNPASYKVYGKEYRVMTNSSGYHEKGYASWYASKFHKQRTSSGEPYDMYALTAAHRTLPLPTYLKVKNLDNGREIIVKVNDRGPFHQGRLLDLSYGAAVKLGIFPKGTAHVEIEAVSTQKPNAGRYYLQAGAFQSKVYATQLKSRIHGAPTDIDYANGRYIVRVGPFMNHAASEQMRKVLQRQGIQGAFSVLR